ncbi:Nfrkb, putative isoform 1 [Theobroma cacao]|uniref:Nfrkb, putative isoform 1 n=2 Tax=Theobroma cacao TaxID=3641 RepID=A0A061GXU0_THECC|nr:Nfrkb, putative isoform 1 [Theobroma cacao]EOY34219.1 Nfrkb, putative isoform 1 [Theobroma cacao]EOY34220.1 Nfrkb, putative isoform 1 [Theobroma cacao]EOY34221.1 Nfrkb, putative isoform 1 [Theobroma cacao]
MMAIEKNNFKVSRFDSEFSPGSRETTMSSDEDELQRRSPAVDSDDDDEFDDADSGAGSDDFDLLELGETRAEFCKVGNLTCSVPFELYDLPGLEDILSLDVWNECLSDEERFSLSKFLPDMDQDTFMRTLYDLLKGNNFHFGSPIKMLFDMLKGGLCEPRVALYRDGLNFFQKRQHYHHLRKHQNGMVVNLCQIRDAWLNCRGYSIEERLRVLNIMRSQKSLMHEKMEDEDSESSERDDLDDGSWRKRVKERKALQKMGRHSGYGVDPSLEFISRAQPMALEPAKYRKQNPKGILKTGGSKLPSAKEFGSHFYPGLDMNSELYGLAGTLPRQKYESGAALRARDRMRLDDDAEDPMFGMGFQRDRNAVRDSIINKSGSLRAGKKYDLLRGEELAGDSFMALPLSSKNDLQAYGRKRNVNQLSEAKVYSTKPPNMRASYDFAKKSKYAENHQQFAVGDQIKSMKGRTPPLPSKGSRVDLSERAELFWQNKNQGEDISVDLSVRSDDWNIRSKKWKTGRESPDLSFKSYKASLPQMNDRYLHSDGRMKQSQEKIRGNYVQNGGPLMAASKGSRAFIKNDETESDSSEQFDDDEDSNPLMRSKFAYPSGVIEGSRLSSLKSGLDSRKTKSLKKDTMEDAWAVDGNARFSRKSIGENVHVPGVESYYLKGKQKGKMHERSPLHNSSSRVLDEVDRKQVYKLRKNGQLRGEPGDRLHMSSSRAYPAEKRQKGEVAYDHSMSQSNYLNNYLVDEEDASPVTLSHVEEINLGRTRKKGQSIEAYDRRENSEASLLGCNTVTKKRKGKEYVADVDRTDEDGNLQSNLQQQTDDSPFLKKKGKRKVEVDAGTSDMEVSELHAAEMGATDVEMETKPQKKPFTLITPTVHTGFSFSIIHLLSAVRMAMITPLPEDSLEVGKPREEQSGKQEGSMNGVLSRDNAVTNNLDHPVQTSVPSLTVHEIVNRVTVNPGDPCILETQEPLQDLVRGVLKIFSSKTAPLGAKGWKALVAYEKSTKSWSWVGPVTHSSNDHETIEEVTSPEAWGLPHKMLVKLVDSFANWLKNGQETLQQIGSLPAPPLELMQVNLDEKERFRDLRAQKSLNTISSSSEEVRAYFRREELLRYSIPDRAFSYTAADGKKSIVAPLRRCGGKPTSKARDHFMLKRDRPPHVTILCLVRDAAARLPGSIGTRADVCTLIRDSQYIVEDVSDAQVNQVVSGALDRLHYERDPCVQFDGERKLWVYLHREREEEDFEDDGTSSTKKWKRQKKDPTEQSDQGAVTVAFHGTGDQSGFDLGSDLNVEPSCVDDDKKMETDCHDRQNGEDNADTSHGSEQGNTQQGHPMTWEPLDLNPVQESKLLCQENSTNEDFDDETFGRERPVGLLRASIL